MLVFAVLSVIFCEDFRQLFRQLFRLFCATFIVITRPVIPDNESGATHRAQFKQLNMEERRIQQLLVKYSHGILDFVHEHGILQRSHHSRPN